MNSIKNSIEEISRKLGEPEWGRKHRNEAFNIFCKSTTPDFRYGLDIRMDLKGLDIGKIDPINPPESRIPAPEGIIIESLEEAMKNRKETRQMFSPPFNKLSALHWALWNRGLFVYIPEKTELQEPVELPLKAEGTVIENIFVYAGSRSSATIVENLFGSPYFRSGVTRIFLAEGATLNYGTLQNYGEGAYNFSYRDAFVGSDAKIEWILCDTGSFRTISDTITVLGGKGGEGRTIGMFFGDKKQQFNFFANSTHTSPHTSSDMLIKGALNDMAKAIYRGLVRIEENAFGSNGYQLEETILLSEEAEVDPVPNLEINNNDVRCTHGTSVGHIDEDKLFYMMTRGIGKTEAKKKMTEGFFEPVTRKMPSKKIEKEIRILIGKKIGRIK